MQRLQKILAAAGVGSRRHCETLIASGRVAVNGQVVTKLGTTADPDKDTITVDGLPVRPSGKKVYILLNKPVGYTCTRSDPHARRTVLDLLGSLESYVYPVGRLDVDTSGLLILTNDGDLAYRLMHPSFHVPKTYLAVVGGRPTAAQLSRLAEGIELEDGLTAPAEVRLVSWSAQANESTIEITLHEGRKRQVRRMFAATGCRVRKLKRIRFGCLELQDLKEGDFRYLTAQEISKLKRLTGSGARSDAAETRHRR